MNTKEACMNFLSISALETNDIAIWKMIKNQMIKNWQTPYNSIEQIVCEVPN